MEVDSYYKVGDYVRIRPDLLKGYRYMSYGDTDVSNACLFISEMEQYRGYETKITRIKTTNPVRYGIEIDGGKFFWVDGMFDLEYNLEFDGATDEEFHDFIGDLI